MCNGEYLHRYFDEYWTDPDRTAFLFRVEGALAGFALVFTGEPHDVAEFFVMRKYRGRGVGAQAAASLLDQFPGRWTVRQQLANPAATAFWRKEVRRLLADALSRPKPPGHAARWLQWRRRHQARSRWFRKRARLARNYALVS